MTSTLERSARTPHAGQFGSALPQVNLLPPEVHASRALKRLKRALAFALIALLLLAALGYGGSLLRVAAANDQFAKAQAESEQLAAAQQEYAEVPVVLGQVAALSDARQLGFSTEIEWTPYLNAIFAVMPADVSISSILVTGATPMVAPAPATDPLQVPSVTRIEFTGKSATIPDTGGWIDALNSIPGFSNAWVSGAIIADDETRGTHFEVMSSVQVTESAYANRFVPEEGN